MSTEPCRWLFSQLKWTGCWRTVARGVRLVVSLNSKSNSKFTVIIAHSNIQTTNYVQNFSDTCGTRLRLVSWQQHQRYLHYHVYISALKRMMSSSTKVEKFTAPKSVAISNSLSSSSSSSSKARSPRTSQLPALRIKDMGRAPSHSTSTVKSQNQVDYVRTILMLCCRMFRAWGVYHCSRWYGLEC